MFRDTIIEADYNPLTAHEATIKYSTRGMEDPLKRDIAKVQKERMELGLVDMLKDSTLGKDTFDTKWWDKTHATPYGYDVNTDGTVRTFKEDPLAAKNKTSRCAVMWSHCMAQQFQQGRELLTNAAYVLSPGFPSTTTTTQKGLRCPTWSGRPAARGVAASLPPVRNSGATARTCSRPSSRAPTPTTTAAPWVTAGWRPRARTAPLGPSSDEAAQTCSRPSKCRVTLTATAALLVGRGSHARATLHPTPPTPTFSSARMRRSVTGCNSSCPHWTSPTQLPRSPPVPLVVRPPPLPPTPLAATQGRSPRWLQHVVD